MASPARPPKPDAIYHASRLSEPPAVPESPIAPTRPTQVQGRTTDLPRLDLRILQDRNEEELQALLDDPELLETLYQAHHPLPQKQLDILNGLLQKKSALDSRLSTLHPKVIDLREQVEASLITMKRLEEEWENAEHRMYSSLKAYSAQAIYARLQAAVTESEKTSETIVRSFLEGDGEAKHEDVQDFIKEYRSTRKLYHQREQRMARWKEGRVGGFR